MFCFSLLCKRLISRFEACKMLFREYSIHFCACSSSIWAHFTFNYSCCLHSIRFAFLSHFVPVTSKLYKFCILNIYSTLNPFSLCSSVNMYSANIIIRSEMSLNYIVCNSSIEINDHRCFHHDQTLRRIGVTCIFFKSTCITSLMPNE